MDYNLLVSDKIRKQILSVPHFCDSMYNNLDISSTLDYFARRFVLPLSKVFDINNSVVVDCGAGYGWFSVAYIILGGKAVIAVDVTPEN